MAKEQISTTQYLNLCQSSDEDMIDLLSRDFEDQHRYRDIKNPVATTWLISFRHIVDHDSLAADYLKFVCFLAEKDIPTTLLPPAGKVKSAEAMGTLRAYAFITERESSSFDIHRLIRLAMRKWLDENGNGGQCISWVTRRLADVFPWPEHENKEIWMQYLPHAAAALEYQEFTTEEDANRRLFSKLGKSYSLLGKYREAEQMHRQEWELWYQVRGGEHPDTLTSMDNLAVVLGRLGRYDEAEQMQREALELRRKKKKKKMYFTPVGARSAHGLPKGMRRAVDYLLSYVQYARYDAGYPEYTANQARWQLCGSCTAPVGSAV